MDDGNPLGHRYPHSDFQRQLQSFFSELASVFFPIRCIHCRKSGEWLCAECLAALKPLGPDLCSRCGRPQPGETRLTARTVADGCEECSGRDLHFDTARAAFCFEGPARSLVHRLKFSGQRRLASFMADLSCNQGGLTSSGEAFTLTYVPLHPSRLLSRGYNQAGLLARALSRRLGMPLQDLLCKQYPTLAQNQLGFDERRLNLEGGFALKGHVKPQIGNGRVLLVDDVYTTGSTVSECARVLREGLGVDIDVFTFARTVRRSGRYHGGKAPLQGDASPPAGEQ